MAMALFMTFYAHLSTRRKIYSKQIGIASLFPIFSIYFVAFNKKTQKKWQALTPATLLK